MSYEVKRKLYELEDMMRGRSFLRVQKSMLLNLMKVKSIKPALGGRYSAILKNGEEVVISRKYVSDLKETLKRRSGGDVRCNFKNDLVKHLECTSSLLLLFQYFL